MKPRRSTLSPAAEKRTTEESAPVDWLELTKRYVAELDYGQIVLTIHQGSVIEVQKTERTRLSTLR